MPILLGLVLFLGGCPRSVIPEYEARRALAVQAPGPIEEAWQPDARLSLSQPTLEEVVAAVLAQHGVIDTTLGAALPFVGAVEVRPRLKIQRLDVRPSDRCEACVLLNVDLDGTVEWRLAGQRDSAPVRAALKLDARLEATEGQASTWDLSLLPVAVTGVTLTLERRVVTVGALLETVVAEWLRSNLLDQIQAIPLGRFGSPELPLRAVRATSSGGGVSLSLLTSAVGGEPLPRVDAPPAQGVRLDLSQASLVALLRSRTFALGAVYHEVVIEATDLSLDVDRFELGLRLWRPVGKGWWRDYRVLGDLRVNERGLRLEATEAHHVGESKGAGFVDPLAALVEGRITEAIHEAVVAQLPRVVQTQTGGMSFQVSLGDPTTRDGVISVPGSVRVQ